MAKIGFIGMGNMGYAMMKGLLKIHDKDDVVFTDISESRRQQVAIETGVKAVESNPECVNSVKYVVLAVKPQFYPDVLKSIRYVVKSEHIIISIAPGITIADLEKELGEDKRIVRAMPNTPALLGFGMTGVAFTAEKFSLEEREVIDDFFSSFGKYEKIDEKLMSAVVCASGSSPAYVYMFIEALADSAVKYGMPRDKAYAFVAQAVRGSAEMVLKTGAHPAKLKDDVCSPGGTTIAGVAALEESGFRNAIIKATDACYKKAEHID
ncbi:MAG: pyrroline-5-carboxylate reductase [Lachnospiraceae bacterium]|nr:pyrroline-5-carboxylate reductase [Lachnospiraceae bacterium]